MFIKIIVIGLCVASCCAKFPSDIEKCKAGDGPCIAKVANYVVRKYAGGRAELGFPPIDPFIVTNFSVNEQAGRPINMRLTFKKVELRGLSTQNFENIIGFGRDVNNSKFEMYGTIPSLQIFGQYKVEGRILLLPIQGEGDFDLVLEKINGGIKFKGISIEKNGLHFVKLQKVKILLDPKNMKLTLTNLFNGNKELGDSLNDVINKNWREAWSEFAPTIFEITENIIRDILQQFLDKNEYDDFYLPD